MKPFEEIAVAFASALVKADFVGARELLAPSLRRDLTEAELERNLTKMYSGYADGPPKEIWFDGELALEEWPAKQPLDVGSVYVGISGDDFNEAVAVVVAECDGKLLIRDVEWGRP